MSYTGGLEREREYSGEPVRLSPEQRLMLRYDAAQQYCRAHTGYPEKKRKWYERIDEGIRGARRWLWRKVEPVEHGLWGFFSSHRGRGGVDEIEAFGAALGLSALYFGKGVVEGVTGLFNPLDYYRTYEALRNPAPLLDELRNNPLSWSELTGSVVGGYIGGKALGAGVSRLLPRRYYAEVAEPYGEAGGEASGLWDSGKATLRVERGSRAIYRVYRASKPRELRGVEMNTGEAGLEARAWRISVSRIRGEEVPVEGEAFLLRSGLGFREARRLVLRPGELTEHELRIGPSVAEFSRLARRARGFELSEELEAWRLGRPIEVERGSGLGWRGVGSPEASVFREEPLPPSEASIFRDMEAPRPRPMYGGRRLTRSGQALELLERPVEKPVIRDVVLGSPRRMVVELWSEPRRIDLGVLGVVGLGAQSTNRSVGRGAFVRPMVRSARSVMLGSRGTARPRVSMQNIFVQAPRTYSFPLPRGEEETRSMIRQLSVPARLRIRFPPHSRFRLPTIMGGRRGRREKRGGREYSEWLYPGVAWRRVLG